MIKILMVCLGNICRSPLAEGILKSKMNPQNFLIDSAGTAAYHKGNAPDKRSMEVARKYGINIADQKARKFTIKDFDTFNYIFVMDDRNYQDILMLARNQKEESKVQMILNEIHPTQNLSVPDPYYGANQGFEHVYTMLEEACEIIANKLS